MFNIAVSPGYNGGVDSAEQGGGLTSAITGAFSVSGDDAANVGNTWAETDFSSAGSVSDAALTTLESDTGQKTIMYGGAAAAVAIGGATAAVPFVVGAVFGAVGGWVGNKIGHGIANLFGMQKVATDGEQPAHLGHDIGHQNKSLGLWGAIAAVAVGAVVAAAIAAAVIATGGAALVVVAAAAAAGGGLAGGLVGGAMSALSQYGSNKGKIIAGSPNVFFEGQMVARKEDIILCKDHPTNPPPQIAEGCETVYANNKQIARLGHKTTCDGNINNSCKTIYVTKATGAPPLSITDSVPKLLRWAAVISTLLPLPRGNRLNSRKTQSSASEAPPVRPQRPRSSCTSCNDPVDVATGEFLDTRTDISLPGTIPLVLERSYSTHSEAQGLLGHKWASTWSQHIKVDGKELHFQSDEGEEITFYAPEDEVYAENIRYPWLELSGDKKSGLTLYNRRQKLRYHFEFPVHNRFLLSRISDFNNNKIQFIYDKNGLLKVEHSDGINLSVTSRKWLIENVTISKGGHQFLVSYEYNSKLLLKKVRSFHLLFL